MIKLKLSLAITAALMVTVPSWAESSSVEQPSSAAAPSGVTQSGGFQSLSPGEQKIARALFLAQKPTANGPAPLSLNQITALRQHEGWGDVFKQMQAKGLIHDKNLGEVVSTHERSLRAPKGEKSGMLVVTKGTGRSRIAGSAHEGKASSGRQDADGVTSDGAIHAAPSDRDDAVAVANAAGTGRGTSAVEGSGHLGSTAHGR